jgi:hypothetical protein
MTRWRARVHIGPNQISSDHSIELEHDPTVGEIIRLGCLCESAAIASIDDAESTLVCVRAPSTGLDWRGPVFAAIVGVIFGVFQYMIERHRSEAFERDQDQERQAEIDRDTRREILSEISSATAAVADAPPQINQDIARLESACMTSSTVCIESYLSALSDLNEHVSKLKWTIDRLPVSRDVRTIAGELASSFHGDIGPRMRSHLWSSMAFDSSRRPIGEGLRYCTASQRVRHAGSCRSQETSLRRETARLRGIVNRLSRAAVVDANRMKRDLLGDAARSVGSPSLADTLRRISGSYLANTEDLVPDAERAND